MTLIRHKRLGEPWETALEDESGSLQTDIATVTTDPDTFFAVQIFDLGGIGVATFAATVIVFDSDGEPIGNGSSEFSGEITVESWNVETSADGITWLGVGTVAGNSWGAYLFEGQQAVGSFECLRYMRLTHAIIDAWHGQVYAGANHPSATIEFRAAMSLGMLGSGMGPAGPIGPTGPSGADGADGADGGDGGDGPAVLPVLVIDDMDSADDWSGVNGGGPTVDTREKDEGAASISMNGGSTVDGEHIIWKDLGSPLDLGDGVVGVSFWAKVDNDSGFHTIDHPLYVRFGASETEYWEAIIPGGTFENLAWRPVAVLKEGTAGFTAFGGATAATWSSIQYIAFSLMTAGSGKLWIDAVMALGTELEGTPDAVGTPTGYGGVVQLLDPAGIESGTLAGVVTPSGAADMHFDATGGLFLVNGLVVYHEAHAWVPDPGDATFDRIDAIFVAKTGNDDSGTGPFPTGYTYEYNVGAPAASPVPVGPLEIWGNDWVRIANVTVPANAVRSDDCTITDQRVVRYVAYTPGLTEDQVQDLIDASLTVPTPPTPDTVVATLSSSGEFDNDAVRRLEIEVSLPAAPLAGSDLVVRLEWDPSGLLLDERVFRALFDGVQEDVTVFMLVPASVHDLRISAAVALGNEISGFTADVNSFQF